MTKQVQDVQLLNTDLERRAKAWGQIGGVGTARALRQADEAYRLYLDFIAAGHLGLDFTRWLSRASGISHGTCYNRFKAGRARTTLRESGGRLNRNQAGLIAELREREATPIPDLPWDDE
ncbi:hypothetical protein [Deinococcus phoenicis]|uniref:hypothetical protein n=1 Tax=Deinococcus phoenicis TaxID=1476583 RepID=UPI0012686082|nr:hypothetical protein [Deinococcus phoenicis]